MRLHEETSNRRHAPFEAEMRRRLWWSITVFDNRVCEQSDLRCAMIAPTWDCKLPVNLHDSELLSGLKNLPLGHETPTDALFVVIRSVLTDHTRRSVSHLESTNPCFKAIVAKAGHDTDQAARELRTLEQLMDGKYLQYCDMEVPLHFMTVWTTRAHLARARFMQHITGAANSTSPPTDEQRDDATSCAMQALECDTTLIKSPLTRGYLWLVYHSFPWPGYIHLVHDIRQRPLQPQIQRIFSIMSENYDCRRSALKKDFNDLRKANPMTKLFDTIVLQAWDTYENACGEAGMPKPEPPNMIKVILSRRRVERDIENGRSATSAVAEHPPHEAVSQAFPDVYGQLPAFDIDVDWMDGTSVDWSAMQGFDW